MAIYNSGKSRENGEKYTHLYWISLSIETLIGQFVLRNFGPPEVISGHACRYIWI